MKAELSSKELADRAALHLEQQKYTAEQIRLHAYRNEADPLFFKAQRGAATLQEWKDKVAEIKQRYPDPA